MSHRCVVARCRTLEGMGIVLHRVPHNPRIIAEWALLCGLPKYHSNHFLVCAKHFSSSEYTNGHFKKLKSGARPSLLLPVDPSRVFPRRTTRYIPIAPIPSPEDSSRSLKALKSGISNHAHYKDHRIYFKPVSANEDLATKLQQDECVLKRNLILGVDDVLNKTLTKKPPNGEWVEPENYVTVKMEEVDMTDGVILSDDDFHQQTVEKSWPEGVDPEGYCKQKTDGLSTSFTSKENGTRRGSIKSEQRGCVVNTLAENTNESIIKPLNHVVKGTVQVRGISELTAIKIPNEVYSNATSGERRPRKEEYSVDAIRQHIHDYYIRKKFPTIKKLMLSLFKACLFRGQAPSLCTVLNQLGFEFKKINGRDFLLEKPEVVSTRCEFLRQFRTMNWENIVFLGETWIDVGQCTGSGGGVTKAVIICHAGSTHGFVPGALSLFSSKTFGDEEMNPGAFKEWFQNTLLPNIPANSVIAMDCASHHSVEWNKVPSEASRKDEIVAWLAANGIKYPDDCLKAEMLALVNLNKPSQRACEVDEIAKGAGHQVIRFPPNHCQYNPIELIWAQVKDYVAVRNNDKATENLVLEGLETITTADWRIAVENCKQLYVEDWEREVTMEGNVEQMFANMRPGSSSDEETSSDGDSWSEYDD